MSIESDYFLVGKNHPTFDVTDPGNNIASVEYAPGSLWMAKSCRRALAQLFGGLINNWTQAIWGSTYAGSDLEHHRYLVTGLRD